MSELTTAARPYAKAVFENANQQNQLSQWSESLAFMGAMAADEQVKTLLDNPRMSMQAGGDAFIQLSDGKLDDKAQNLIKLLAENNRLSLLPEISRLFEQLKDEAEGSIEAHVRSALALSESEESAIANALAKRLGKEVKLVVDVDESLLGGAIIEAGDLKIDGSIRGRLEKMTSVMMN